MPAISRFSQVMDQKYLGFLNTFVLKVRRLGKKHPCFCDTFGESAYEAYPSVLLIRRRAILISYTGD